MSALELDTRATFHPNLQHFWPPCCFTALIDEHKAIPGAVNVVREERGECLGNNNNRIVTKLTGYWINGIL